MLKNCMHVRKKENFQIFFCIHLFNNFKLRTLSINMTNNDKYLK